MKNCVIENEIKAEAHTKKKKKNLTKKDHRAVPAIKLSFFPQIRKEKNIIENEVNIKANKKNDL